MAVSNDALILIVDDEETIRTLLSRALMADGHTIISADTVAEALYQISRNEFDLLLIDKNLPDGSGLQIIAEANEQGHRSETILITGYSDTESAIQAVALGVFRYIRKPFDLDALKIDIKNALETGKLRRDLARRTRDLEVTNKELWDALRRVYESERRMRQAERLANIGYLAAGVAHEINNPLSLLSMTIPFVANEVENLIDSVGEQVDRDRLSASLTQIDRSIRPTQEAVEFLMRLASDLHSLGRVEKQDPRPVKLAEVAGSAMRLVRHQLKHKAKVVLDVDESLILKGHASRLVQVFINLLTNAAKAIQKGPAQENCISIRARVEDAYLIVDVSDTGVGIPEDHLDKIFRPFFTFSLKDEDRGTGIGLALVKEIIDEHDGTIRVSSKKGEGTTFSLILPYLAPQESPSAIVQPDSSELTRSKRRILFLDSESANLTAYEESFGSMHEVLLAQTLEHAAKIIEDKAQNLDAFVCELALAQSIWPEFTKKLAKWPELERRLIFVGDDGAPLHEIEQRGMKVLRRPVRPAVLLGTIYQLPVKAN